MGVHAHFNATLKIFNFYGSTTLLSKSSITIQEIMKKFTLFCRLKIGLKNKSKIMLLLLIFQYGNHKYKTIKNKNNNDHLVKTKKSKIKI